MRRPRLNTRSTSADVAVPDTISTRKLIRINNGHTRDCKVADGHAREVRVLCASLIPPRDRVGGLLDVIRKVRVQLISDLGGLRRRESWDVVEQVLRLISRGIETYEPLNM